MLCWTGAGGQRLCGSPSRPDQGVGNWCSQTQLKGVRAADGAQEASGYAATLADLTGEAVLLVPFFDNTPQELQRARFTGDGVLEVRTGACRAAPLRVSGRQTSLLSH